MVVVYPHFKCLEFLSRFFTTELGKGFSGLGLNNDYNLVTNKLGGKIMCISELGVGTTMRIEIPNQVNRPVHENN